MDNEWNNVNQAEYYLQNLLDSMNGTYDPQKIGLNSNIYIDPSEWP